ATPEGALMRAYILAVSFAVILTAGGFVIGRAIGHTQAQVLAFDLKASSYDSAALVPRRTTAGFSGFEPGSGLDGGTLITGDVVSSENGALLLETAAGRQTVRVNGD